MIPVLGSAEERRKPEEQGTVDVPCSSGENLWQSALVGIFRQDYISAIVPLAATVFSHWGRKGNRADRFFPFTKKMKAAIDCSQHEEGKRNIENIMSFCCLIEECGNSPGQHSAVSRHDSGIKTSHLLPCGPDYSKTGEIHQDKEQVGKG